MLEIYFFNLCSHFLWPGLLSIEHKNLNPENEMKRMFGSKVVMADQPHRHKRGQRHRAPHHSRSSHWLVVPKPGWPQASRTGLAMKFIESDKFGNQHFTFDHSASYQTIQKRFFHAVDSFNPEFIIVRIQSGLVFFLVLQGVSFPIRVFEMWL